METTVGGGQGNKLVVANLKQWPYALTEAAILPERYFGEIGKIRGGGESDKRGENKNQLNNVDIVVCPPSLYLSSMKQQLEFCGMTLGAQDVSEFHGGAHTGEISAEMLANMGCRYVIVGHSERRQDQGEDDATIARKMLAASEVENLATILCVGETLEERNKGDTMEVLTRQLTVLLMIGETALSGGVAYEPLWAIGTGKAATLEEAQETLTGMRQWLASRVEWADQVRFLYGGSVNSENAGGFLDKFNGVLVGGASQKPEVFASICLAAMAKAA